MMKGKTLKLGLLGLFAVSSIAVVSCGGGGGGGGSASSSGNTTDGYVVDEPIKGLTVIDLNTTDSAITDDNGYFSLTGKEGDTLQFKLGNLTLFNATAKKKDYVYTPYNIKYLHDNSNALYSFFVLVRGLDEDDNPANGIQLPQGNLTCEALVNATSNEWKPIGRMEDVISYRHIRCTVENESGNNTVEIDTLGKIVEGFNTIQDFTKRIIFSELYNTLEGIEGKNLSGYATLNDFAKLNDWRFSSVKTINTGTEGWVIPLAIQRSYKLYKQTENLYLNGKITCNPTSGEIRYTNFQIDSPAELETAQQDLQDQYQQFTQLESQLKDLEEQLQELQQQNGTEEQQQEIEQQIQQIKEQIQTVKQNIANDIQTIQQNISKIQAEPITIDYSYTCDLDAVKDSFDGNGAQKITDKGVCQEIIQINPDSVSDFITGGITCSFNNYSEYNVSFSYKYDKNQNSLTVVPNQQNNQQNATNQP
jgi:predicted transcriptional regulator